MVTQRENIRFAYEWDEQRYHDTLRVCCLEHDIEMLPDGDLTEIGGAFVFVRACARGC